MSNTTFAEPVDIEIDWIIEGQNPPLQSEINSESDVKINLTLEEQINSILSLKNENSENSPEKGETLDSTEDYITGSNYMISGNKIDIDSEQGKLLNKILIEQREINKENFFHLIKYLDRYSDGYVELAEALIDPVKQQNYAQDGTVRAYNINSNLEYFLVERGYDLTDLGIHS